MAILITGAAGFVALNIVEHLLRSGRDVVGLDRIALPERARREFAALPGRFTLIGGSILSSADLRRALTIAPIEAVIHCAVITAGSAREKADPEGIVAVNVQGAVSALMAAARHRVTTFVYPSSGSIYGTAARDVPLIDEDALSPAPVALYGLTKRAAETILPRIAAVQGIRFAAGRLGSVYGPWEYATGVRDTLSPMLQVLECAMRGGEAVLSPSWRGDFIYSRDVADGLVRLAEAPALSRTIYNIGSGSLGSAASWCEAVARALPGFRWRLARANETGNIDSHTGFDRGPMAIGKVARDTGYAPRYDFVSAAHDWIQWLRPVT
ncbi:MAG TPA: NAD(P)-dependent oxidoreductase [Acetobacteraceae bacterium]|jgi:nucleoside-diphosphate-sugar epimerase|nr:NAD(P)-dependent oxidoreductase [Acetobacteraceae bacterium]